MPNHDHSISLELLFVVMVINHWYKACAEKILKTTVEYKITKNLITENVFLKIYA